MRLQDVALRVLLLVGIFLVGYVEAACLKRRDMACATWFPGLGGLTAWIVYPLTLARVGIGVIVAIAGLALMTVYYRAAKHSQPGAESVR